MIAAALTVRVVPVDAQSAFWDTPLGSIDLGNAAREGSESDASYPLRLSTGRSRPT